MHSCIYEGVVRHRRYTEADHQFQQSLFMMYLDLSELDEIFRRRWLWSTTRRAIAEFRRSDHFGDPQEPLDETVRNLVEARLGFRPKGPVRVLTNLRYYGYVFNPVSLYYCYSLNGLSVEAVVAEVSNTPWNERHLYVIAACDGSDNGEKTKPEAARVIRARHSKEFHVSPFMPMDMDYCWRLSSPGSQLAVGLQNIQRGDVAFRASLSMRRREISPVNLAKVLARYPVMTAQIFGNIYWQAFRLWLKQVTYFPHPGKVSESAGESGKGSIWAGKTVHNWKRSS